MGPGITLLVIGAILAFAVRADASAVDLQTVGLIFMVAGAAVIAYARRERRRTTVVQHVEQDGQAREVDESVHETVTRESVPGDDLPRHPA